MTESDNWLEHFDQAQRDIASPLVYWLAIPMVVLGVVGLLWSLPVPDQFYQISPLLNWGSAFLMAAAVYYFIISLPIAIGLLPFLMLVAFFETWLTRSGYSLTAVAMAALLPGIAGLWIARREQAEARRFVSDLLHAMMAPAWMLSVVYRRLGIPY